MGWSSSMSVWGQFSAEGSPLALWLYSSEQYYVHRFSISRSSVRHFPERSWIVVAFPFFTMVKSFTSWYALLLLIFFIFSPISPHCSPIQFSLAFFMHLLMLLFILLYFSDASGSNIFFLTSLLLSHSSRISAVTQGVFFLFFLTMFAKDLTGCFSHRYVKGGDYWIHVCIFIIHDGKTSRLSQFGRFPTHWPYMV